MTSPASWATEDARWKGVSVAFFPQNHGKYHIGVDMHHAEGQALIRQLAARSDILVENFKPGTTEAKWGLGYRQLREINPRLIYVANTGFGQWGPFAEGRASYDGLAQAVSGLTGISGFEGALPIKSGNYLGDWFGACLSALGALAALRWRDRTGEGQLVEMAQCEGLVRALDWTWLYAGLTGRDRARTGNRDPVFVPSGIYPCADGHVAIVAGTDAEFRGLAEALGRPDLVTDPRFETAESRRHTAHADALDAVIQAWCAARRPLRHRGHGAAPRLRGGPGDEREGSVRGPALPSPGQRRGAGRPGVRQRGGLRAGAAALRHSRAPQVGGRPVGWHNRHVLQGILGLPDEHVAELERRGIVGRWGDRRGAKPPPDWSGEEDRL